MSGEDALEIPMTQVDSSSIHSHGFDDVSGTLDIKFRNGKTYRYYGVSADTYQGMQESDSIGSFARKNIIGNYKTEKLGD